MSPEGCMALVEEVQLWLPYTYTWGTIIVRWLEPWSTGTSTSEVQNQAVTLKMHDFRKDVRLRHLVQYGVH